jgi:hypothetical protein
MLNKEVYPDFIEQEEYERELAKLLALESVPHAFMFYLAASYSEFIKNDPIISQVDYIDLCDFLSERSGKLVEWAKDFSNYTCSLKMPDKPEDYKKGEHYPVYVESLLEGIQSSLDVDYRLEVHEELESAN